jgi:hypothetical protein
MDIESRVNSINEQAERLVRYGAMSGGAKETVVDPLISIISQRAKEVERLQREVTKYADLAIHNHGLAAKAEKERDIAVKALEHYTDDTIYCGNCDQISYGDQGELARKTLAEIKNPSTKGGNTHENN